MNKIFCIFATIGLILVSYQKTAGSTNQLPYYFNLVHNLKISAMNEIWKDVNGYDGLYQVSNLGKVKSLPRFVLKRDGRKQPVNETILKQSVDKDGYLMVSLYKDKQPKMFKVHRLMALSFLDNPNEKPQVNHINGIKNDNILSNLEWATLSENRQHAYDTGLQKSVLIGVKGSNHPTSKEIFQYTLKKELVAKYGSIIDAERETGILTQNICSCAKKKAKTAGGFIWEYKQ